MGVGYPDAHWRAVAELVANHPEKGEFSFSPSKVVADAYQIARATGQYWVRRARETGYLQGNELGYRFAEEIADAR